MDLTVATRAKNWIEAAKNAIYTESVAIRANQQLISLQDSGKELQRVSEVRKKELSVQLEQLHADMSSLQSKKNSYECSISAQSQDRDRAQHMLESQQGELSQIKQELSDAYSRLHDAECDLHRQERKKKTMTTTAVTVGVAAVVLGIFTGGVGAVALAPMTAATATGAVISSKKVDEAKRTVNRKNSDISRLEGDIRNTNSTLSSTQSQIESYKRQIEENVRKVKAVHDKITSAKSTIAFMMETEELWNMFEMAVEKACERTERLKGIMGKATQKKSFKVLRSDGTIIIIDSFVDAWVEVSMKQGQIVAAIQE